MLHAEGDRFLPFSPRAQKVLQLAQEEARSTRKSAPGSEHILLGIARDGESVGARVLQFLGLELSHIRAIIDELSEQGEEERNWTGLSPDGVQVVRQALEEARKLNHQYVGTEHLLLAITRSPDCMGARALLKAGIGEERVRTQIIQMLSVMPNMSSSSFTQQAERSTRYMWRRKERSEGEEPEGQQSGWNDRFHKFDEHARKVLALAQEESLRFQHNFIGTEHLLLGLVRLQDSSAGKVLQQLGVELNKVRESVEFIIGRGDRMVLGEIGLTPRAKKVIQLAVDEARRLNHHSIGTEHILLGLVREGEGIASGVLESLGVKLQNVREAVLSSVKQERPLLDIASAYTRGEKPFEARASSVQDVDDLMPEPLNTEEQGNFFSLRSRRVLAGAHVEAQKFARDAVGTEHLLLALLQERNGIAYHVLHNLGLDQEHLRTATNSLISEEDLRESGQVNGFTTAASRAIELALAEARQLGYRTIGTEHLLLGVLHSEGMASGILITRGLTLEKARTETRRLLGL